MKKVESQNNNQSWKTALVKSVLAIACVVFGVNKMSNEKKK